MLLNLLAIVLLAVGATGSAHAKDPRSDALRTTLARFKQEL